MSEATATVSQHTGRELSPAVSRAARFAGLIKLLSIIAIIIGLFLIMRTLPIGAGVNRLESLVESLGASGLLLFGGIYILATVLFIPGSALTLVAGAIFGLGWGFITVSLASTSAAAISFLIARYLARNTVREQAARYPRFSAVDRAIGQGGWKVVGLLRLVPLFPFSVGNYLLGLTPVRFWPYVLASWIGMMPGTLVYVYFGHIGRASVEAAAGEGGRHPLEWALIVVGLLAALAVTVYLTRLARRKLAEQTDLDEVLEADSVAKDEVQPTETQSATMKKPIALAATAVIILILGACATLTPNWLSRFFGPPAVAMVEVYDEKPDGPTFDHSDFDRLLRAYVSEDDGGGWVDYAALAERDCDALQRYIAQLGEADFDALGRDEKLALLINAYNAFTLELILEYWNNGALKSIQDIPSAKRWKDERWRIGEHVWSLNQIEHQEIRPKFKEPRIHWAVVCAAIGCPPLSAEAYTGAKLDAQLDDQARRVHSHPRWFRFDREAGSIHLTKLYDWYGDDFIQTDGGVLKHAAKYVPDLRRAIDDGIRPQIRWLDYDWDLNHRPHVKGSDDE